LAKISSFIQNFDVYPKFGFLTKISIVGKIWLKFPLFHSNYKKFTTILAKLSSLVILLIFEQNFEFWPKFTYYFCHQILIFGDNVKNFYFLSKTL